jgi:hypothetical protein
LPVFQDLMADLGPIVGNLVDNFVRPLVDSFAELFSMFESSDGSFNILKAALLPLEIALTSIKALIDAIVFGLKLLGFVSNVDVAAAQAVNNDFRRGERNTISAAGTRFGSSEDVRSGMGIAPVSLTIGTQAQNTLAYKYGQGVKASTGTRTGGR